MYTTQLKRYALLTGINTAGMGTLAAHISKANLTNLSDMWELKMSITNNLLFKRCLKGLIPFSCIVTYLGRIN